MNLPPAPVLSVRTGEDLADAIHRSLAEVTSWLIEVRLALQGSPSGLEGLAAREASIPTRPQTSVRQMWDGKAWRDAPETAQDAPQSDETPSGGATAPPATPETLSAPQGGSDAHIHEPNTFGAPCSPCDVRHAFCACGARVDDCPSGPAAGPPWKELQGHHRSCICRKCVGITDTRWVESEGHLFGEWGQIICPVCGWGARGSRSYCEKHWQQHIDTEHEETVTVLADEGGADLHRDCVKREYVGRDELDGLPGWTVIMEADPPADMDLVWQRWGAGERWRTPFMTGAPGPRGDRFLVLWRPEGGR